MSRRIVSLAQLALVLLAPAILHAQDVVVRGTVRGPDRRPLAQAEVIVADTVRVRTDSVGAFTVSGLAAGTTELLVRRVGFAPLSIPLTLAAGQRRTLAIELAPLPYAIDPVIVSARRPGLYGLVVDEGGAPIAGAELMVVGAGRRVTSGKDGGFAMPELTGRTYMVLARAAGHFRAQFAVDVPADHGQEVRVTMGTIGDGVRGHARLAAAGLFWSDSAFMRDLDHRLRANVSTALMSRAELLKQRDRGLADVLADDVRTQTMLAPGSRGPTSIIPAGTSGKPSAGSEGFPFGGQKSGGWCYFMDGEPVLAEMREYFFALPASSIESIEIVPNDVTNTLNHRITDPTVLCKRFIVVWPKR